MSGPRPGPARVLAIAGSDSGGGAGIQADIKTITALGGYAATAVTAVTVQNTLGVAAVHPVPPDIVAAQIAAVLDDIGADAIKIGMLGDAAVIDAVAGALTEKAVGIPLVLDPVMVAKGGASLLADSAMDALRRLLPLASVITPNAPELAALTGMAVSDQESALMAAARLRESGASAVLAKGGHLPGDPVVDLLLSEAGPVRLNAARLDTRHTHGTGCTLASALATGLAQGLSLADAARRAQGYVHEAIRRAPGFGAGHGPLDHGFPCRD